jgi:hypothetical protein
MEIGWVVDSYVILNCSTCMTLNEMERKEVIMASFKILSQYSSRKTTNKTTERLSHIEI